MVGSKSREAYVEGRLKGLNELVMILKDAVESPEPASNEIVRSIIEHISNEMTEIVDELSDKHGESHPVIREAEKTIKTVEKHAAEAEKKPAQAPAALKKSVTATDDLMKSLIALREKTVSEEEK